MPDPDAPLLAVLDSEGARIYTLLTRLTLCEATAEDLMQELFLRLSRSKGFAAARDPAAYAIRSATNLAFEWRRRQQRTVNTGRLAEDLPGVVRPPDERLRVADDCAQVLKAMDQMPAIYREVVVLHRLEDHSFESVAAQIGKTAHQARAIYSKAIARLRQLLGAVAHETEELRND